MSNITQEKAKKIHAEIHAKIEELRQLAVESNEGVYLYIEPLDQGATVILDDERLEEVSRWVGNYYKVGDWIPSSSLC